MEKLPTSIRNTMQRVAYLGLLAVLPLIMSCTQTSEISKSRVTGPKFKNQKPWSDKVHQNRTDYVFLQSKRITGPKVKSTPITVLRPIQKPEQRPYNYMRDEEDSKIQVVSRRQKRR